MPGQPINYHAELGQARCRQILRVLSNTRSETNELSCILFKGSRNNYGYGQTWAKKNSDMGRQGRDSQTAFLVHIVAWVARNNRPQQPGHQISHLCHNRNCFNPDHLLEETAQVNNSRKNCTGPIFCPDHGQLLIDLCEHEPRCIMGRRKAAVCCKSIEEVMGGTPLGVSSPPVARAGTSVSGQSNASSHVTEQAGAVRSPWLQEALAAPPSQEERIMAEVETQIRQAADDSPGLETGITRQLIEDRTRHRIARRQDRRR